VADAAIDVREAASFVSDRRGGHGAVRELIERILRTQDKWAEVLRRFSANET
jgi:3-deoxy-D-manno-octulosonate 8-phosphate phosphatase KdsC-like HAD superfamily phosphatase